ncbi:MAG: hypothetical protein GEV03_04140 [Streptosporangiales bacterium]|nr:hypothetical protein [Streptosporangiales bacterium]
MRFRMLGPLEIEDSGRPIEIKAAKQRTVLAVLLLQANRPVDADQLVEQVWGQSPPPSARTSLQAYVYRLRNALRSVAPCGVELRTRPPGYLLAVPEARDLDVFERSAAEGNVALESGDPEGATRSYRAALGLWRGPLLADVDGEWVHLERRRLEEVRLTVLEQCLEAELALGRHRPLVPELEQLVRAHPFREALWAKLMLALWRSGRQADALAAYSRVRASLVEELGIEPGEELERLHRAILSGTADERPAVRRAVPALLPPDLADFTGREEHVRRVVGLLAPASGAEENRPRAVVVSAITGMGGVGKTSLAVHAAHRVRPWFPDCQMYVNLRGADE